MRARPILSTLVLAAVACAPIAGGQSVQVLKEFGTPLYPYGRLLLANNGFLYGTTEKGQVFRMLPDGSSFSALGGVDEMRGGLIQGADGRLYGSAFRAGVFSLSLDGSSFRMLATFVREEGYELNGELVQDANGWLYGTAAWGGAYGHGSIFRVAADGSAHEVLYSFSRADGSLPNGTLAWGADGFLYGTTLEGGVYYHGTVFKVAADGSGFTLLHSFDGTDGAFPRAGLVAHPDGLVYGVTGFSYAGKGPATLFRVGADAASFAILYRFTGAVGGLPQGALLVGTDHALYGTTVGGPNQGATVFRVTREGAASLVHGFPATDGQGAERAYAGVAQGPDGSLFGVTRQDGPPEFGKAYKVAPNGRDFAVIHSFDWLGGGAPSGALAEGVDGMLYGTTREGGRHNFGVVFRVARDGSTSEVVRELSGVDGCHPEGQVIRGSDDAIYGSTTGCGYEDHVGQGTIFRVSPDGEFSVIQRFETSRRGSDSISAISEGPDGFLYGLRYGEQFGCNLGCRELFRLSKDGAALTTVHVFDPVVTGNAYGPPVTGSDGLLYGGLGALLYKSTPDGSGFTALRGDFEGVSPIQASDGRLYSVRPYGGAYGRGSLLRATTDGSESTVLRDFDRTAGTYPRSSLLEGRDGLLYGTTQGGSSGRYDAPGTLFRVASDGTTFEMLHEFNGWDGYSPIWSLIQGSDGAFYGVTNGGGSLGLGVVFRLSLDGDSDADGFPDDTDNCPVIPNRDQLDTDADLVGDACDNCPATANTGQQDVDHDGIGDACAVPPEVEAGGHRSTLEGARVDVSATFSDGNRQERHTARIEWGDGLSEGGAVTEADGAGSVAWSHFYADNGRYIVTVHIFDRSSSGTDSFEMIVDNSAPAVEAGQDRTVVVGTPVSLAPATFRDAGTADTHAAAITWAAGSPAPTVRHPSVSETPFGPPGSAEGATGTVADSFAFASPGTYTVEVRVTDDDGTAGSDSFAVTVAPLVPEIAIGDASINEGQAGGQKATFVVSRTFSETATTLKWSTVDGSARADARDYVAASGSLAFGPRETTKTISIAIRDDAKDEADESYFVVLSKPVNGTIVRSQGLGAIVDDDPKLALGDAVIKEGHVGTRMLAFPVTLSGTRQTVTVRYQTADDTARVSDGDYVGNSGTLTFLPGTSLRTIDVTVNGDRSPEPDERLRVVLLSPVNATIQDAEAVGTIRNDDPVPPSLSISDASAVEGSPGLPGKAKFTVMLSSPKAEAVSVSYETVGDSAMDGGDFVGQSGSLVLAAGTTSKVLKINLVGDSTGEATETFSVRLSGAVGASIVRAEGIGTIQDDDGP